MPRLRASEAMTVTNVICGDSFSCGRAGTRCTERLAEHAQCSWNASSTFADRDFGAEARLSVVENRRSIGALAGASDRPRGGQSACQSACQSDRGSASDRRPPLVRKWAVRGEVCAESAQQYARQGAQAQALNPGGPHLQAWRPAAAHHLQPPSAGSTTPRAASDTSSASTAAGRGETPARRAASSICCLRNSTSHTTCSEGLVSISARKAARSQRGPPILRFDEFLRLSCAVDGPPSCITQCQLQAKARIGDSPDWRWMQRSGTRNACSGFTLQCSKGAAHQRPQEPGERPAKPPHHLARLRRLYPFLASLSGFPFVRGEASTRARPGWRWARPPLRCNSPKLGS